MMSVCVCSTITSIPLPTLRERHERGLFLCRWSVFTGKHLFKVWGWGTGSNISSAHWPQCLDKGKLIRFVGPGRLHADFLISFRKYASLFSLRGERTSTLGIELMGERRKFKKLNEPAILQTSVFFFFYLCCGHPPTPRLCFPYCWLWASGQAPFPKKPANLCSAVFRARLEPWPLSILVSPWI